MTRFRANLLLLSAGALWGMGFIAQSTAMDELGPWAFTAAKFGLASLALLPLAAVEARRATTSLPMRTFAGFCLVGGAIFLAAIAQQIGIVTTTVTNSGFLTGLYVVLTPLLCLALLRERPHWIVWPAACASFAGIALLGGGSLSALNTGDLWTIVSAMFWALQIMLLGQFAASSGRPFTLSLVQFAVTAVAATIGTLAVEEPTVASLAGALPEIVYGGVVATALAFTLQVFGQSHTTPAQASILLSSEAVFAALFGAIFLAERIGPIGYFGCGLILCAMLAVELVPKREDTEASLET
ncbi:DMT family transporter [Jiella mangrovi]|uniref:DMT family transporter n=1 Tax=Jiella mangrovi TaxID=2821407 RepID=A0ABS4BCJ7_9HYPH|nr:DMT family transporter [Jiella mangrovi]